MTPSGLSATTRSARALSTACRAPCRPDRLLREPPRDIDRASLQGTRLTSRRELRLGSQVRRRHAARFLAVAEEAGPELRRAGQDAARRRLEADEANIREAEL